MTFLLVSIAVAALIATFASIYGGHLRTLKGPWILESQTEGTHHRGYRTEGGIQVMLGLTLAETQELEALDTLPPLDDDGNHVAWKSETVISTREARWLELHTRHEQARNASRKIGVLARAQSASSRSEPQ